MDHDNFLFSSKMLLPHTHNKRDLSKALRHIAALPVFVFSYLYQPRTSTTAHNTCPFVLLCPLYCCSLETKFPARSNTAHIKRHDECKSRLEYVCLYQRTCPFCVCIFTITILKHFILLYVVPNVNNILVYFFDDSARMWISLRKKSSID